MIRLTKAHAYGNDFLLAPDPLPAGTDPTAFARAVCDRHRGVGADGLLLVQRVADGASMKLLNADGSPSELSGNGVRCVGAWLVGASGAHVGAEVTVHTDAGAKLLQVLSREGHRVLFRTAMGLPEDVRRVDLNLSDRRQSAVTLRIGNPQCVVLGAASEDLLHILGPQLTRHPHFPQGTNVELAEVLSPNRIRILIWERGVGPTSSSGTGTCAAAVAAASFGGASRTVTVDAPGGSQTVEWTAEQLWLTGWAEVTAELQWLGR